MAEKRAPITATKVQPLGERPRPGFDPDLAADLVASANFDPEAAAAAMAGVSADPSPAGVRDLPTDIVLPDEMPNPDDDGKLQEEIDARRTESQRQAAVRKAAVEEHISAIDADANHPLRGAAARSRNPFGSRSARLSAPRREGFHRHWFNDVPGRVEIALRAGYKIVNDVDGKPMKRVVGVGQNNDALHGYYMETPIEWYVQDMRRARKSADDLEQTIQKGKLGAVERHYTPRTGIEYEEETGGDYRPRA